MPEASPLHSWRRSLLGTLALVVLVGAIAATAVLATRGAPAASPTPVPSSPSSEPARTAAAAPTPTPEPITTTCPSETAPPPASDIPAHRAVNFGVEDLVDERPGHLEALAERLDQVGANTVSISVGRLDWIEFPWAGNERNQSSDVIKTGRDYVGEAVNVFRCAPDGTSRTVILGIDTLFGRDIQRGTVPAGQTVGGWSSDLFASLSAWKSDELSSRLIALAEELAVRYQPDAINITELFFDTTVYGPADLVDFRSVSGMNDWPRRDDGGVDAHHPAVTAWKTDALTGVLAQLDQVLTPHGVELTADVRGPLDVHTPTRADIGQDYPRMLEHADRLNVWDFPGVNQWIGVLDANDYASVLFGPAPERYSLEIGLWLGGGAISPDVLRKELAVASDFGIRSVSVTPASLMTDAHWNVLQQEWREKATP
ncbi:hypothetical protein PTQ19_00255 [Microbacterium esteraromaticum]|uniref:hypothetical protein n=1 Tax=Microbacterium esteraromaticum TaxID=57043 RepID=UPI002367D521|nr:hypothetical protein [Microbacterium esteraromaticum]WDH78910.1 hypothetical protein PTQ19_00255 [Microbacterium esteraromaticum]